MRGPPNRLAVLTDRSAILALILVPCPFSCIVLALVCSHSSESINQVLATTQSAPVSFRYHFGIISQKMTSHPPLRSVASMTKDD